MRRAIAGALWILLAAGCRHASSTGAAESPVALEVVVVPTPELRSMQPPVIEMPDCATAAPVLRLKISGPCALKEVGVESGTAKVRLNAAPWRTDFPVGCRTLERTGGSLEVADLCGSWAGGGWAPAAD